MAEDHACSADLLTNPELCDVGTPRAVCEGENWKEEPPPPPTPCGCDKPFLRANQTLQEQHFLGHFLYTNPWSLELPFPYSSVALGYTL